MASALAALGCADHDDRLEVIASHQPIIYGSDSRIEYGQASSQNRFWADSVAIMMDDLEIEDPGQGQCEPEDATCALLTSPMTTADPNHNGIPDPLCNTSSGSPASNYGKARARGLSTCTAFLVAPDIMATAGHCFDENGDGTLTQSDKTTRCDLIALVFGFDQASPGAAPTTTFSGQSVYHCAEVLDAELGTGPRAVPDWALFRLDRKVTGRTPLFVRYTGTVEFDSALVTISHPGGLSKKIDPGGAVIWNTPSEAFFEANLDGFTGSSGGPVINEATGVVEGIYSDGNSDYAWYSPNQCWTDHVCTEAGCSNSKTEHISRITQASSQIPLHAALVMAVL